MLILGIQHMFAMFGATICRFWSTVILNEMKLTDESWISYQQGKDKPERGADLGVRTV